MEMVGVQWVMAQACLAASWIETGRPGAPVMMGYLAVAQTGPMLVLGLLGGVVADRVNRRKLLLFTQFLLMLVAAVLTWETFAGRSTPWMLMAVSAATGIIMVFNVPAWQVLTPRLVPRDELTNAITLNGVAFNMARVIGPALAGLLLDRFGAVTLFLLNTLSFLGCLAGIWTTPDAPAPPRDKDRHAAAEMWEGCRYVFGDVALRRLILSVVIFSALGTPMLRMMPILVSEVYHAAEKTFGVLLAIMGIGAVVGGFSLRLVPAWYPKHHLIPLSIMLGGLCIGLYSMSPDTLTAGITVFLSGFFWMWSFNSAFAALQLLVEDQMRGRALALCNVLSFGSMPLGALAAGYIGEFVSGRENDGFGTQVGLGLLAAVLTVSGLVMLIWRTPEIDGVKPGEPLHERRRSLIAGITASAHKPPRPQG